MQRVFARASFTVHIFVIFVRDARYITQKIMCGVQVRLARLGRFSAAAVASLLLPVVPAFAMPVTFMATGHIVVFDTVADPAAFSAILGSVPQLNGAVSLTLTYDSALAGPDQAPNDPTLGEYMGIGLVRETFTFGSTTLISSPSQTLVLTTTSPTPILGIGVYDGYSYQAGGDPANGLRWATQLAFVGGHLSNDALPAGIPDLASFAAAGVGFRVFSHSPTGAEQLLAGFGAAIDSVTPIQVAPSVPEPATFTLLLLVGLWWMVIGGRLTSANWRGRKDRPGIPTTLAHFPVHETRTAMLPAPGWHTLC
jgi:hypothetical protein